MSQPTSQNEQFLHLTDEELAHALATARKKMRQLDRGSSRSSMLAAVSAVNLRSLEAESRRRGAEADVS